VKDRGHEPQQGRLFYRPREVGIGRGMGYWVLLVAHTLYNLIVTTFTTPSANPLCVLYTAFVIKTGA